MRGVNPMTVALALFVFLEEADELGPMSFLAAEVADDHVLGHVVHSVAGLDDFFVLHVGKDLADAAPEANSPVSA